MKPGAATSSSNGGPVVADLTVGKAPPPEVRPRDASDAPPEEELAAELEASVPQVDATMVRSMLRAIGGGLGFALGDEDVPEHWRFTERELDELAGTSAEPGPLTRIINRNAKLRRAVIRGDEMAVAVAFGGYMGRNVSEGNKARKVRRERDGETDAADGAPGADGPGLAQGGGLGGRLRHRDGRLDDDPAGGGLGR
jgi:hypothetical protein